METEYCDVLWMIEWYFSTDIYYFILRPLNINQQNKWMFVFCKFKPKMWKNNSRIRWPFLGINPIFKDVTKVLFPLHIHFLIQKIYFTLPNCKWLMNPRMTSFKCILMFFIFLSYLKKSLMYSYFCSLDLRVESRFAVSDAFGAHSSDDRALWYGHGQCHRTNRRVRNHYIAHMIITKLKGI